MHIFNVYFLMAILIFCFLIVCFTHSFFKATDVLYLLSRTSLPKSHAPCGEMTTPQADTGFYHVSITELSLGTVANTESPKRF